MLTHDEIIERMLERQNEIAEMKASEHHEYMMRTDDDFFIEHSDYLDDFLTARENFVKELRRYDIDLKPEDFL